MKPTSKFPYKIFDTFLFRTPCFPIDVSDEAMASDIFSESVFIASPVLHSERLRRESLDDSQKQKVDTSIQKYYSRAKSRCTPYGLFAGCSTGEIGDTTRLEIGAPENIVGVTRLDMNIVSSLVNKIEKMPEVQNQLLYYPNNSIYELGGKIRYVEYSLEKQQRFHRITSVESSEYLADILKKAKVGSTVNQLSQSLVGDDISREDAVNFIKELIDAQILKSELEISVTGEDPYKSLLHKIEKIEGIQSLKKSMHAIMDMLVTINTSPVSGIHSLFLSVLNILDGIGIAFESGRVFQVDMFKPCDNTCLSNEIVSEMTTVMVFLNKCSHAQSPQTNDNLRRFKEEFVRRYEDEEVPLSDVLDLELGLGYPTGMSNNGDINPLIDKLKLPSLRLRSVNTSSFDNIQSLLMNKYIHAMIHSKHVVELTDEDLQNIDPDWRNTHDTIDLFFSMFSDDGGSKFLIKAMSSGSSAAKLMSRFSHIDSSIHNLVMQITQKEQELKPDKLIAEVVHLPQAVIGNLICRPNLRKYEIPYLCAAGVASDDVIPLSDILVSVRNNRIMLRSKKWNREIEPRLTMAHNYHYMALPLYSFLGDIQSQDCKTAFGVDWGDWAKHLEHKPRISYNNFILSRESWVLKDNDIKQNAAALLEYLDTHQIPRKFIIPEHDNELLIDVDNALDTQMLMSMLKKRKTVEIAEFLFEGKSTAITSGYTNEFILSFYREKQ